MFLIRFTPRLCEVQETRAVHDTPPRGQQARARGNTRCLDEITPRDQFPIHVLALLLDMRPQSIGRSLIQHAGMGMPGQEQVEGYFPANHVSRFNPQSGTCLVPSAQIG